MAKMSLKAARVNIGLSQKQVAEKINVNPKTVWSWENGITYPNPVQIQALCDLYHMSYDDIIFLKQCND